MRSFTIPAVLFVSLPPWLFFSPPHTADESFADLAQTSPEG